MSDFAESRASFACETNNKAVNEIFQSRLQDFQVRTEIGSQVASNDKASLFSLYEGNMKPTFEAIGEYDRDEKYNEIFNEESRIVMLEQKNHLKAFVSLRFDTEEGEDDRIYAVVYLYELQVEKDCRGKKIGKRCIDALNTLTKHLKLDKTMLTVSKSLDNPFAVKFYSNNQFIFDEIDPSWYEGGEDENYHIMSRV
ncbi:hypothetical protein E3P94_03821 [Wallemia ichthyophaga]|nr:hypothetical protein E3P95_03826 [Wallemia ichthyophaga]TIA96124.1 hypothetical protein E3P94_03821 [Wallemia ichthyophaga]